MLLVVQSSEAHHYPPPNQTEQHNDIQLDCWQEQNTGFEGIPRMSKKRMVRGDGMKRVLCEVMAGGSHGCYSMKSRVKLEKGWQGWRYEMACTTGLARLEVHVHVHPVPLLLLYLRAFFASFFPSVRFEHFPIIIDLFAVTLSAPDTAPRQAPSMLRTRI